MALGKCRECGKEMSSSAKTCPACGATAKVPMSLGTKLAAGAVFAVVLWALINPDRQAQTAAVKEAAAASAKTEEATERTWSYRSDIDQVTRKPAKLAEITSLGTQDLHWPYGPGIAARIVLQRHPRYGLGALVFIDKGQILCTSYQACGIMVRFDDRPPAKYFANRPSDGSSEAVFIQNYGKFLSELKRSQKVLIELPLYQDGARTWEFKVAGLSWQ